jgi:hypothetical protein
MTTDIYRKTGWFTFFIVVTGILPAINAGFSVLSSLSNIFLGATVGGLSKDSDLGPAFAAINVGSGLGGVVINGLMLALFVYYTMWLWRARTALQAVTEDNTAPQLVTAQANLLRFTKVSTILEIVGTVFAVFLLVAILGLVGFAALASKGSIGS